ncbi:MULTISPECIES: S26 family signal peptidase [unclassified Streptomyces]|uniref:S26 family signal peptidase n=1 Tax=unclassified Streptomyces TaxID=2593676 RepID=UPI000BE2DDC7|nr:MULTISPECIES: hypothetical protein [unclassified Streptomyces]
MIKRVAAVPGEPVAAPLLGRCRGTVVPRGYFLALGGNTAAGIDSRHHGYLPPSGIRGRVVRQV